MHSYKFVNKMLKEKMYSTTENVLETANINSISMRDACYKIAINRIENKYLDGFKQA